FPPVQQGERQLISSMQFEGFEVSWAGRAPGKPAFCFGSEDGRFLFTDSNGVALYKPDTGSLSGEAINGLAFVQRWIAVSTRNEVTLWTLPQHDGEKPRKMEFSTGAHDVISGTSGCFFAPLGLAGFLFFRPQDTCAQAVAVGTR